MDKQWHSEEVEGYISGRFANHLKYSLRKDDSIATGEDFYAALAMSIRDIMIDRWMKSLQTYRLQNVKRVYYLSLEYLIGKSLASHIINLGIAESCNNALTKWQLRWEDLCAWEPDAGLGNGGLGRLAACFLDSMATMQLPAMGYGLRYEYGAFRQKISDGYQKEEPDEWLRPINVWQIARPSHVFPVCFGGEVEVKNGLRFTWKPSYTVLATPYDMPVSGYNMGTVNTLRLWAAKASEEFYIEDFNKGDYIAAVRHKIQAENLTRLLYPSDHNSSGRELRFRQQYFFVCCSLQDILRRFKVGNDDLRKLPEKVAIQLNDTHPAIAIAELMRILVDLERVPWELAWDITVATFGYTNHTLLPEALEKWPLEFFERLLPRHLQIIYEINRRFLHSVALQYPGDNQILREMSLVEEGERRQIRMAYLSVVGSHSTNGVSQLHTRLLKEHLLAPFCRFFPQRFNNKTNGISQRRWLLQANPLLAQLITDKIGDRWITDLSALRQFAEYAKDEECQQRLMEIRLQNKRRLVQYIADKTGIIADPTAIYDVHIKRIHEYKRQLLNVLRIIADYICLKENLHYQQTPRVFVFSGKAAPNYTMAKTIIKLIHSVAQVINNDKSLDNRLQVVFLPNYNISCAEMIIPAADISEQISTVGMEASGTGNMKLALNGALTVATLDGANIELLQEIGKENMFTFGLTIREVAKYNDEHSYRPWDYYYGDDLLRKVLGLLFSNFFSLHDPGIFEPIRHSLLERGDRFYVLADFRSFIECHRRVEQAYHQQNIWNQKAIANIAQMGKFSSDRAIAEYAREIWGVPLTSSATS